MLRVQRREPNELELPLCGDQQAQQDGGSCWEEAG